MVTKRVNLSLDMETYEKAKEKGLNVSEISSNALQIAIATQKKDLPDECLAVVCKRCRSLVPEFWICPTYGFVYCRECSEKDWICAGTYAKVAGARQKEHKHYKYPPNEKMPEEMENGRLQDLIERRIEGLPDLTDEQIAEKFKGKNKVSMKFKKGVEKKLV